MIPKKHCDEKNKFCHPAECIGDGCKNKPSDCTDEEMKNEEIMQNILAKIFRSVLKEVWKPCQEVRWYLTQ